MAMFVKVVSTIIAMLFGMTVMMASYPPETALRFISVFVILRAIEAVIRETWRPSPTEKMG